MKTHFLFLAAVLVFAAYGNTGPKGLPDVETIVIDYDKAEKSIDLKNIFSTVSFQAIALETNANCLIGEVTKMEFRNDTIFIVDKISKSIFLFNDKGKFLSKIFREGRGPQEYLNFSDVFIGDNHILVIDNYQFKVCCYDFKGKFRYGFDAKDGSRLAECDGKIFVSTVWGGGSSWNDHKMAEFDKTGHLISSYIKMDEVDKNRMDDYNHFLEKKNGFEYLLPYKNIVYSYKNGRLTPSYKIDFGKYNLPDEIAAKGIFEVVKFQNTYSMGVYKILYLGKYRLIFSRFNARYYCHIYDTVKKTISTSTRVLIDGAFVGLDKRFVDENQILGYYPANDLCKFRDVFWAEEAPNGPIEELLYPLSKGLADDDNGVIVRIKYKVKE